ncbi:MAG: DNA repair protein RecO [Elusimicrobia bacterium]|nr:DNA repair protein RecO [Elusimicrobiota bacterium]
MSSAPSADGERPRSGDLASHGQAVSAVIESALSHGRGRIVNAEAVVLSRSDWAEADRLAVVYTELYGRMSVRFIGVNRPRAKLRCLSEPMARVELRLHLGGRQGACKAIGGRLIDSFPAVRSDLRRTLDGLALAEMLLRLTPEWSPNEDKYRLLVDGLEALERGASRWIVAAFGLRLLELAGVGLGENPAPGVDPRVWEALHRVPWEGLARLPFDESAAGLSLAFMHEAVKAHAGREIRSLAMSNSLFQTSGLRL